MSRFKVFNLPTFGDSRGALTVLDGLLPFQIVRAFWIYGADGQTRGGHRHHKTHQALIALNGSVTVYMNDGFGSEEIVLDNPAQCLHVEPKDWHTMKFKGSSVLLVLASHNYDHSDYIYEKY